MPQPKVLALFDFDGTLARSDTFLPFLRKVVGISALLRAMLLCSPQLLAMAFNHKKRDRAKIKLLQLTLNKVSRSRLEEIAQSFSGEFSSEKIDDSQLQSLLAHLNGGDEVVIVSASLRVYVEPIARKIGVTRVIATELEYDKNGICTGKIKGENCNYLEKKRRIEQEISLNEFGEIYAYGDSRGDLPMLSLATTRCYRGKT